MEGIFCAHEDKAIRGDIFSDFVLLPFPFITIVFDGGKYARAVERPKTVGGLPYQCNIICG